MQLPRRARCPPVHTHLPDSAMQAAMAGAPCSAPLFKCSSLTPPCKLHMVLHATAGAWFWVLRFFLLCHHGTAQHCADGKQGHAADV
jgi:hypothetical protein